MRRVLLSAGLIAALVAPVTAAGAAPAGPVQALTTRAADLVLSLLGPASTATPLPFAAGHVAIHWTGAPDARVTAAFGNGATFGPPTDVGRDEVGEQRGTGETYGAVLPAGGATAVRLTSDRPIGHLTAVAMADAPAVTVTTPAIAVPPQPASPGQPPIVSRAAWGADESLRFAGGREVWPPSFRPVQKLILHHTAGLNNDPDPAATVRAIFYYHAVVEGWGDIGYNFLIDEAGRIYKGRSSHAPGSTADTITGEDAAGRVVTAGHALGFNPGTVGIALLGNFTNQDATPAAKASLDALLAWEAGRHGIDPLGSSTYVNPDTGTTLAFPNIAGHRDVNPTECPGNALYNTLPVVRLDVAVKKLLGGLGFS